MKENIWALLLMKADFHRGMGFALVQKKKVPPSPDRD